MTATSRVLCAAEAEVLRISLTNLGRHKFCALICFLNKYFHPDEYYYLNNSAEMNLNRNSRHNSG